MLIVILIVIFIIGVLVINNFDKIKSQTVDKVLLTMTLSTVCAPLLQEG